MQGDYRYACLTARLFCTTSADCAYSQPFAVRLSYSGEDPRVYCILSKEFIDDGNGNVCGVKTVKVEWTKGEGGRWNMAEVPGTEKTYEADYVFLGAFAIASCGTHTGVHAHLPNAYSANDALLLTLPVSAQRSYGLPRPTAGHR